jgi:DNA-binding transcriptional LysR family regulator
LERAIGVRLLERRRPVRPTAFGLALLPHLEALRFAADNVNEVAERAKGRAAAAIPAVRREVPLHDRSFDPDLIDNMAAALEKSCARLKISASEDETVRVVAAKIIDFAGDGERDPDALCRRVIQELHAGARASERGGRLAEVTARTASPGQLPVRQLIQQTPFLTTGALEWVSNDSENTIAPDAGTPASIHASPPPPVTSDTSMSQASVSRTDWGTVHACDVMAVGE